MQIELMVNLFIIKKSHYRFVIASLKLWIDFFFENWLEIRDKKVIDVVDEFSSSEKVNLFNQSLGLVPFSPGFGQVFDRVSD